MAKIWNFTLNEATIVVLTATICLWTENAWAGTAPQGGGTISYLEGDVPRAAWQAQYWINPTWSGSPVWEQSQARVRFDWGTTRPILGVTSEQPIDAGTTMAKDFPKDNFSVRFDSRLIARFNEIYTFRLTSDGGASLKIRQLGAGSWTTVIAASAKSLTAKDDTGTIALTPNTIYEARVEYVEDTGLARCELRWSAPSFPEEVLDFGAVSSSKDYSPLWWVNAAGFQNLTTNTVHDANGWPTTASFGITLMNGYAIRDGWYRVTFRGKATVKGGLGYKLNENGTVTPGNNISVPKGTGYNTSTGITEFWLLHTSGTLSFTNAERNDSSTGVTDIQIQTPKYENKDTNPATNNSVPHHRGEFVHQAAREAFLPFAIWRFQSPGLSNTELWSERTPANWALINNKPSPQPLYHNDYAMEKIIVAANEIGRDLHLCFSGSCDEEYMYKLALLVRYGGDANGNPYTTDVAEPYWPPLNTNLRLYLEHGNEMAWSAIQPSRWKIDFDHLLKGTATDANFPGGRDIATGTIIDGAANATLTRSVLDFDGHMLSSHAQGIHRYHAYRSLRMGEQMRAVFGDSAMGEVIRPVLFGQYEVAYLNSNLQFVDDYYNNGNGNNVPIPHPPKYFFWAGGPASYYGPLNMWCEKRVGVSGIENLPASDEASAYKWLSNRSFEDYNLPDGTLIEAVAATAANAGWTFLGNSGVVNVQYPLTEAVASISGTTTTTATAKSFGYRFTVGPQDLYLYQVGRRASSGNQNVHTVAVMNIDGTTLLAYGGRSYNDIATNGIAEGGRNFQPVRYQNWTVSSAARVGLYRLKANTSYYIVSVESGTDTFYENNSQITPAPGIASIDGPVEITKTSSFNQSVDISNITFTANAGRGYGSPTFKFTSQLLDLPSVAGTQAIVPTNPTLDPWIANPAIVPGAPAPTPLSMRNGEHMAFIAGQGEIKTNFTATEADEYVLVLTGFHGHLGDNRLDIFIDGEKLYDNALLGANRKPKFGLFNYGTRFSKVLQPGTYEIKIVGKNTDPLAVTYIDSVQIGSMKAYFGDNNAVNMLGSGTATGEVTTVDPEGAPFIKRVELVTMMALNWGLVPYVYEGGTNPGGDWNGENVFYAKQAKYEHPLGKVADNNWSRIWHEFGGFNDMYYYEAFEQNMLDDPFVSGTYTASFERGYTWQLEPTKGTLIPSGGSAVLTTAMPHAEGRPKSDYRGYFNPSRNDTTTYNTNATIASVSELPPLANKVKPNNWKSWRILAQVSGNVNIALATTGSGSVALSFDDGTPVISGNTGGTLNGSFFLTKGMHTVKVRALTGTFDISQIQLTSLGTPIFTANAGPDQSVEDVDNTGVENVTLTGSASGSTVTSYVWSWTGGSATGAMPTVSLPVGATTLTLTVTDDSVPALTATDTVTINVTPQAGSGPPVADAGNEIEAVDSDNSGNESVTLDGSASTGRNLTYQWSWSGGGTASGLSPTVSLPVGTTTLTLTVTDDYVPSRSDSDTVTVTITEPPAPPLTPTGLGTSAISPSQIQLTWTDNAIDETGYLVERKTGAGAFAQIVSLPADTVSVTDFGLPASTTFTYRVRAVNTLSQSEWSNTSSATTQAGPPDTLLVYEPFNDLNGTGSIGIVNKTGNDWPKGTAVSGLSYTPIPSSGSALKGATTFGATANFNGTGLNDQTLWFSAMVQNTGNGDRLMLFSTASGSSDRGVGLNFTASGVQAVIGDGDGDTTVTKIGPIVNITPSNINFIVGKLELSSTVNDIVTIWVNPSNLSSEIAMGNVNVSSISFDGSPIFSADSGIYPRQNNAAAVFDEIRLGTTLAVVTTGSIAPTPTGYDAWKLAYPWPQPGVDDLPEADPNGDGIVNFMAYATDIPPLGSNALHPIQQATLSEDGQSFVLVFRRPVGGAQNVLYKIMTSINLSGWEIADFSEPGYSYTPLPGDPDGDGTAEFVEAIVPISSFDRFFIHLRVSQILEE